MSALVVDASVVVRLFIPGAGTADARRLVERQRPIIAPALVYPECGNAIWKQARKDSLDAPAIEQLLEDLMLYPIRTLPLRRLTTAALHLAVRLRHPIYDCYYLAAAILNDCELATADRRLAELAREVGLGDRVILIGASAAGSASAAGPASAAGSASAAG